MNIHLLSDLHLECAFFEPPVNAADVVVLAGDIGVGTQGVQWAKDFFDVPVIYVVGNHEYHDADITIAKHMTGMKEMSAGSNVMILDNESIEIGGVRFVGSTMWTDLKEIEAVLYCDHDNILINYEAGCVLEHFNLQYAQALFEKNRAWLKRELSKPFDGKTVVITHHAPSFGSLHAQYAANPWNPCFISDLEYLMGSGVDLWMHGHTHNNFDYRVDGTRVVCNPRGYPNPLGGWENRTFDPDLMVQLEVSDDNSCE